VPAAPRAACPAAIAARGGAGERLAAFQIDSGNPDVAMSWDNTVKYSNAFRVRSVDPKVADNSLGPQANTNDGDQNFGKGLISNRLDLLSELEFRYRKDFGFRVSGAAWYDDVYNRGNDNRGALGGALVNTRSVRPVNSPGHRAAARPQGRADGRLRLRQLRARRSQRQREGRPLHPALRREPVLRQQRHRRRPDPAGPGQGPVGAQLPVQGDRPPGGPGVHPGAAQPDPVGGRLLPAGMAQVAPAGGGQLLQLCRLRGCGRRVPDPRPGRGAFRGQDIEPRNSGQGASRSSSSPATEYGFYAAQFHDKMPQFYARPGVNVRPAASATT
jgi:hypothetical protein